MTNRNKRLFGEIVKDVQNDESSPAQRRTVPSHLLDRTNRLSEINSGEIIEKTHRLVNPDQCRMWVGHNRRYDLLNEHRCDDLIKGFKSQGKQELPAIVRALKDDPDYEYEVICGARRHWTVAWLRSNNYPQFKFLIEVRDLTDEEAFRLSDIENRDREDISDYERALDYRLALERYYKKQKDMAIRLDMTETRLSRYLDLASMPQEIVTCYTDPTHIRISHWVELKKLYQSPKTRSDFMDIASELAQNQKKTREEGGSLLDGQQVYRQLMKAANQRRRNHSRCLGEYYASSGNKLLTIQRNGRQGFLIHVVANSGADVDEIISVCNQSIREHIKN
jgi:ParB family chromosome partitioning protein